MEADRSAYRFTVYPALGDEDRPVVALVPQSAEFAGRLDEAIARQGMDHCSGKVWDVVKRRCKAAGLPSSTCNHSFRATGITIHQENKGRLEDAQALPGHANARTRAFTSAPSARSPRPR